MLVKSAYKFFVIVLLLLLLFIIYFLLFFLLQVKQKEEKKLHGINKRIKRKKKDVAKKLPKIQKVATKFFNHLHMKSFMFHSSQ